MSKYSQLFARYRCAFLGESFFNLPGLPHLFCLLGTILLLSIDPLSAFSIGDTILKGHGSIITALLGDYDHDGSVDLVLARRTGAFPDWKVNIEFHSNAIAKNKQKPAILTISGGMLIDDGTPVTGQTELFLLTDEGLQLVHLSPVAITVEPIIKGNYFPFSPEPGDLPRYDFVRNFDSTEEDEILLFTEKGFKLYRRTDDGLSERLFETDDFPVEKTYLHASSSPIQWPRSQSLRKIRLIPSFSVGDANNDRLIDLLFQFDDELWIYLADQAGFYRKNPLHVFYNCLNDRERTTDEAILVSQIFDIDSDGHLDLLMNKLSGSPLDQELKVDLFWGQDLSPKKDPATIFRRHHVSSSAFVFPFERKHRDLVLTEFNTGVFSIVKALISKSITVSFSFYPLLENTKMFSDKSRFTLELKFKVDLDSMQLDGFLPVLEGDFNGDGLTDALVGNDQETTSIHFQKKNRRFAEKPDLVFKGKNSGQIIVIDLNKDHLDDIVFLFDKRKGFEEKIRLVVMRKR